MTTYRAIATTETDADSPVTATLMSALANNPTAIAEGSSGAPVSEGMWHPYDMASAGDGSDGLFYDHSVDGTVSSVETPAFEDGYEYMIIGRGLSHNDSPNDRGLVIQLYRETSAAWSTAFTGGATDFGNTAEVNAIIEFPRVAANVFLVSGVQRYDPGASVTYAAIAGGIYTGTAQKISKARLYFEAGSIDAGTLQLMRRRELLSA